MDVGRADTQAEPDEGAVELPQLKEGRCHDCAADGAAPALAVGRQGLERRDELRPAELAHEAVEGSGARCRGSQFYNNATTNGAR